MKRKVLLIAVASVLIILIAFAFKYDRPIAYAVTGTTYSTQVDGLWMHITNEEDIHIPFNRLSRYDIYKIQMQEIRKASNNGLASPITLIVSKNAYGFTRYKIYYYGEEIR